MAAAAVLILTLPGLAAGKNLPVSFTGTVSHRKSDDEEATSFNQSSSLALSQDLTSLMRLGENIRYSSRYTDGSRTESLTPSVNFSLVNDIFSLSLTGTANKSTGTDRTAQTTKHWGLTWGSKWARRLWPQLRLNYSQSFTSDDNEPPQTDTASDDAGFNLDWNLLLAQLHYSLSRTETENMVDDGRTISTGHNARLNTGTSLFNNRLGVNLSQRYSRSERESSSLIGESGSALIPVTLMEARAGWPLDPSGNPDYAVEPDWGELGTGFPTPVVAERYNIALQLNERTVDTVYLSTADDISTDAASFDWDLYSSEDGLTWKLEQGSIPFSYDPDNRRFELEFAEVSAPYLMLVEDSYPLLTPVAFTDVETLRRESGTPGREIVDESITENYQTNGSLKWRIREDLGFGYNIAFEKAITDNRGDVDKFNHSANLGWRPRPDFNSALSLSESRNMPEDDNETMSRSYSLAFTYNPLETLNFNLGITRSEGYEEGSRKSVSHGYSLYTSAEIYPDLTTGLDLTYNTSKQDEDGSEGSGFSAGWRITARLIPELSVNLNETYTYSKSDRDDSESYGSSANLNWRPSAMFSLSAGARKSWRDGEASPLTYNIGAGLALTGKNQVNAGYSHGGSSDSWQAGWNWTINDMFSFRTNYGYTETEDDSSYSFGGSLTMRY